MTQPYRPPLPVTGIALLFLSYLQYARQHCTAGPFVPCQAATPPNTVYLMFSLPGLVTAGGTEIHV
jgi:hypothetical protein